MGIGAVLQMGCKFAMALLSSHLIQRINIRNFSKHYQLRLLTQAMLVLLDIIVCLGHQWLL